MTDFRTLWIGNILESKFTPLKFALDSYAQVQKTLVHLI